MRRRNRLKILVGAILIFVLFYDCFLPYRKTEFHLKEEKSEYTTICPQFPITKEILVVLRTGATEALDKLPIHFTTTLKCISEYVIYSDYEEIIQGHKIHDVLDEVSEDIKASAPEFEVYKNLRKNGRAGLETTKHHGSGPTGSLDNPSWKLDKFKFLPMVDRALKHRPDAKWFVFMEADTYLMWTNLLEYLSKIDASRELYIGKHMFIGDVLFAHGGSGFVLSAPAMRKVVQHWRSYLAEYESYTVGTWAGDMVLGKVLKDVGIPLFWAFPHFQGDPVSSLDHNVSKLERQPWCYPPITYHHMREEDIRKLWTFEQAWWRKENRALLHRDVFKKYIVPKLAAKRDHWDNLSIGSNTINTTSIGSCHVACEAEAKCLQYTYAAGTCLTSGKIRLGEEAQKSCVEYSAAASKCIRWLDSTQDGDVVQSGWMLDRLPQYLEEMDGSCHDVEDGKWVI